MATGRERRRAPRVACSGPAKVFAARTLSGTVKDVSIGGAFVQLPLPMPSVGSELTLKFQLPGDPRWFEVTAEVRFHATLPPSDGGPGLGVKFLRLPREAQEAIDAFVTAHWTAESEPPARGRE